MTDTDRTTWGVLEASMAEDIAAAVGRRKVLMALVPDLPEAMVPFIDGLVREAASARKKLLLLGDPGSGRTLMDSMVGSAGRIGSGSSAIGIERRSLKCSLHDVEVTISDSVDHCSSDECVSSCPYLSGFSLDLFRRARESGGDLSGIPEEDFRQAGMCRANTLLDLAGESRFISSDHGILFSDPSFRALVRLGIEPAETVLAIHDPLSLLEYLWSRYSLRLAAPELAIDAWPFDVLGDEQRRAMSVLFDAARWVLESTGDGESVDRKVLIDALRQEMSRDGMEWTLPDLIRIVEEVLQRGPGLTLAQRQRVRDLHLFLRFWFQEHSTAARYVSRSPEPALSISVIAPQILTSSSLSAFHSVVMFGDTVYPHDAFSRTFGLSLARVVNRTYMDPAVMERCSVVSLTNMDLSMNLRPEEQFGTIASNIAVLCRTFKGPMLCIFPSYSTLDKVLDPLGRMEIPRVKVIEEKGMRRDDREALVEDIGSGEDVLGLAVQNGVLARALERGGLDVTAAVLVGLQFNPPSPESRQKKLYFQENFGSGTGELVSRILPATAKAMRTVNAQLYTSKMQRKLVVLMDRRYHDRKNMEALPQFWDVKYISDPEMMVASRFLGEG